MANKYLSCLECGEKQPYSHQVTVCHNCSSDWLNVEYQYDMLRKKIDGLLDGNAITMWKYKDFLPIEKEENIFSLDEGGTPLILSERLSNLLDLELYIKDESQNPNTKTFKDRGGTLAISGYKEMGHRDVVVYSTGHIGMAYTCYAEKADMKVYVFLPKGVSKAKIDFIKKYPNAVIFENCGDYSDAKDQAIEYSTQHKLHMDRGVKSIFRRESKKILAFEIFEQLGKKKFPDWYFQSISGGLGALGVDHGFWELQQLGYNYILPKLGCIQIDKCNPMVRAYKKKTYEYEIMHNPDTPLLTLATGNPIAYPKLYDRVNATGGLFEDVSMEETHVAYKLLKEEGIDTSHTSAVALAGIFKLAKNKLFKPGELVVFLNSGGDTD